MILFDVIELEVCLHKVHRSNIEAILSIAVLLKGRKVEFLVEEREIVVILVITSCNHEGPSGTIG